MANESIRCDREDHCPVSESLCQQLLLSGIQTSPYHRASYILKGKSAVELSCKFQFSIIVRVSHQVHEYHGSNNVQKKMKKLKNKQRKRLLKKLALFNRKQDNETVKQINDCEVSKWSEWSACSQSCGLGKRTRTRVIVKHSKDQGQECPHLMETQWCGSARECTDDDSYFRW